MTFDEIKNHCGTCASDESTPMGDETQAPAEGDQAPAEEVAESAEGETPSEGEENN